MPEIYGGRIECVYCHDFFTYPELVKHFATEHAGSRLAPKPLDERKAPMPCRAPMGDVLTAVAVALRAMAELADVEAYDEYAHLAELVDVTARPGHVFAPIDGFSENPCKLCNERPENHRDPVRSVMRAREIERDHGYRTGWNTRGKILAARLRSLADSLESSELPSHASGAV